MRPIEHVPTQRHEQEVDPELPPRKAHVSTLQQRRDGRVDLGVGRGGGRECLQKPTVPIDGEEGPPGETPERLTSGRCGLSGPSRTAVPRPGQRRDRVPGTPPQEAALNRLEESSLVGEPPIHGAHCHARPRSDRSHGRALQPGLPNDELDRGHQPLPRVAASTLPCHPGLRRRPPDQGAAPGREGWSIPSRGNHAGM